MAQTYETSYLTAEYHLNEHTTVYLCKEAWEDWFIDAVAVRGAFVRPDYVKYDLMIDNLMVQYYSAFDDAIDAAFDNIRG